VMDIKVIGTRRTFSLPHSSLSIVASPSWQFRNSHSSTRFFEISLGKKSKIKCMEPEAVNGKMQRGKKCFDLQGNISFVDSSNN